jgi:hypothetical protein
MADWGLYTALRGTDNWQQRRQDKMVNLQIAQQQRADEEKKVEKSMLAEEKINEYLDAINDIDVLPEDQERIQEVERQSRASIVQGIANYNGDLTRYMSSGGITDLHEYKNSITQSEEVKTALQSKENMAKIIKDKEAGRYIHPISYTDIEVDGEGNEVEVQKFMTPDQQITAFKNGDITSIDYNGSEKKVQMNAMTFHGTPKDPQNPYSEDNLVTTSDIKFWAMSKGASEEYADHLADNYYERTEEGGEPWYWGNLSAEDKAIADYKSGKGRSSGGSGKTKLLDTWENSVQAIPVNQQKPVTNKEQAYLIERLGFQSLAKSDSQFGGQYRWGGKAFGRDSYGSNNPQELDLSTAEIIGGNMEYVHKQDANGNPIRGMMFTVAFDDDDPNIAPGWFINDKALPGEERNFVNENDKWTGQVFVGIDDLLADANTRAEMNKTKNLQDNAYFTPATGSNEYDIQVTEAERQEAEDNDRAMGWPLGTTMNAIQSQYNK